MIGHLIGFIQPTYAAIVVLFGALLGYLGWWVTVKTPSPGSRAL